MTPPLRALAAPPDDTRAYVYPAHYRADKTVPGVISCHHHGATYLQVHNLYHPGLGAMGFAGIGGDLGGNEWGSDDALTLTTASWDKADAAGMLVKPKTFVFGVSMGGATGLNWTKQDKTRVRAAAFVAPLIATEAFYAAHPEYNAEQAAAYGGAAAFHAASPTHDPTAYAASISDIPVFIAYSDDDELIDPAWVHAFAELHGNVELLNLTPRFTGTLLHGATLFMIPFLEIARFYSRCL